MTDWDLDVVINAAIENSVPIIACDDKVTATVRAPEGLVIKQDQYNGGYWRINQTGSILGAPCVEMAVNGMMGFQAFVHRGKTGTITVKVYVPASYEIAFGNLPIINLIDGETIESETIPLVGAWNTIIYTKTPAVDTIYKIEIRSRSYLKTEYIKINSVVVTEA